MTKKPVCVEQGYFYHKQRLTKHLFFAWKQTPYKHTIFQKTKDIMGNFDSIYINISEVKRKKRLGFFLTFQ